MLNHHWRSKVPSSAKESVIITAAPLTTSSLLSTFSCKSSISSSSTSLVRSVESRSVGRGILIVFVVFPITIITAG